MDTTRSRLVRLATAFAGVVGAALPAAPALELYGVPAVHKITPGEGPSPAWQKGRVTSACARNEWEALQVVVRTSGPVSGVALRVSDLRSPQGGVLPARGMRLRRVEWVDVNAPFDPATPSAAPELQPDPLVPISPATDRYTLEPGRNLVFWIMVGVPAAATAGEYAGELSLVTDAAALGTMSISLRVRDFALPPRPILQSMIGLAEANLYKAHGCTTAAQKEAVIRLYFDEYIRARLSPFLYAPSTIAFNPLPDGRIHWEFVKGPDGQPTGQAKMDFAGFDREAEVYLNQRQAFSAFNTAPYLWTRTKQEGKETIILCITDSTKAAVASPDATGAANPVFDRLVVSVFRQIAAHLDEKGWLDRAVYYVTDEPGEEDTPSIAQICRLVREADPRLRTALTYDPANRPRLAELVDEKGRSLISLWIPYCSLYREEVAARERAKGAEYWLYDVKDTSLITHSGLANRGMFWTVWQRDAKGYLYYLSTYWGRDVTPWDRPSFLLPGVSYEYRQGDGYFFYPPQRRYNPEPPVLDTVVTSIRWELMREGAEDYDTLRLLEGLTTQAEARGLPAAEAGRAALARARTLAENLAGSLSGAGIAQLQFSARQEAAGAIPGAGWSFSAQEGWLHHRGGQRADLPIRFATSLPDGSYDLVLNVYADADYRGRPYSRFLVDGRPLGTRPTALKGPEDVNAGSVAVQGGRCGFTLSAVEEAGVILYRVALRRPVAGEAGAELYAVRGSLGDAIEQLQAALGGAE
jgi:hypothetical protein